MPKLLHPPAPRAAAARPAAAQVEQLPDYIATAAAAAREMRALRARVDRGQARSKKLLLAVETGAPLMPSDLGALAEGTFNALGSLLGWGSAGGGGGAAQQQGRAPAGGAGGGKEAAGGVNVVMEPLS